MVEGGAVLRRRGIEGDAGAHVADLGYKLLLGGGGRDQRLHADLELSQRAAGLGGAGAHRRQHHLLDVGRRADRMGAQAVGDLAHDPAHQRIDRGQLDRNARMLDGAGIEQRHREIDVVVRALHVELGAVLPAVPDGAHRGDIFADPRPGGRPGHAVAALDMRLDLRAEPQREAAARQLLQGPGAHGGDGRAAREGDGDGGGELQLAGRLGGERHDDERIVLGLLDDHAVVADFFEQPRVRRRCWRGRAGLRARAGRDRPCRAAGEFPGALCYQSRSSERGRTRT